MSTIEIYAKAEATNEALYCVYCDGQVTNKSHCIPCNEYKSVVCLTEYVEIMGHYPKLELVK